MANYGMLGSLPPGLRGMLAAEQMGQQRSQNQLGQIGGMLSLQGQMQNQAMQQQGLVDKQQQQDRLTQFASQLPEQERAKFMLSPMEYIKEANKKYVIGGALVPGSGGAPIYEAPREMKIGPAGQVYDPRALQAGQVMADPNKPFQIGPHGNPVPNQLYQKYEIDKARAGKSSVNVEVKERQRNFENEDKLRADFSSDPLVKSASEMQNAFNLIEAAYTRPSAANDLAMATKYMKILDPTSVVRESEFALAVNATGLLDKVQNYSAAVLEGKKLNPNQRKDFYDSAKSINDAFQKQRGEVEKDFSEMTTGYNLNPKNVIPSLRRRSTDRTQTNNNDPLGIR